jgi:hypothetical protein
VPAEQFVRAGRVAAGVADARRPWQRQRELHHLVQFGAVLRRHQHHARHAAQERDVVEAVVRRAVFADEATAVHREDDRHLLQHHFLEDLVVAALQEGRVDGCDRAQATLRHARGHGDRVLFRDAGVVEACRNARLVGVEPSA